MSEKLPVAAAIPNYNMAESLGRLIPQTLEQGYDEIYVLDDASTDDSQETVAAFGSNVHFVGGHENIGAGGNRSRIIGALTHQSIIHFIDADMELESDRMPEQARELLSEPLVGFIGGLIKDHVTGRQHFWNYGPRQCLHTDLTALLQGAIEAISAKDYERAKQIRHKFAGLLREWPDPFEEPVPRQTFWTTESNLIIRSEVFKIVGGYDPTIKNHEIQDLSIRLHKLGLPRKFDPSLSATHTAVQVRGGNRAKLRNKAEFQIARKNGLISWLLPEGHLKPKQ